MVGNSHGGLLQQQDNRHPPGSELSDHRRGALSPAASALRDSMSRSVGIADVDSRMEHNMAGTYIQVIHSLDTWVAVFLAVLSA
jgi:hypothetical protein